MTTNRKGTIKVYHGFGHKHDMEVFGHAFGKSPHLRPGYSRNPFRNMFSLLRLFFVQPLPGVPLQLAWKTQQMAGHTEYDGFYRIAWTSTEETPAGWHEVEVRGEGVTAGTGKVFVPHITQFGFISDIDDTVLISHSAATWKRLKVLLFKNAADRRIFNDTARHYKLLSTAHTSADAPNPFFYVSSSEWNLYDYLVSIFRKNGLPEGAFLLSQVKRWHELWKTGKTKHEGKLLRIIRVLEVFPNQRFILFGDNSQSDPAIYGKLAEKYGHRIFAVYIRNIRPEKESATRVILQALEKKGIHTFLFRNSADAIEHSRKVGLIE